MTSVLPKVSSSIQDSTSIAFTLTVNMLHKVYKNENRQSHKKQNQDATLIPLLMCPSDQMQLYKHRYYIF